MIQRRRAVAAALVFAMLTGGVAAQQPTQPAGQPPPQPAPTASTPAPAVPGTVTCPAPPPPAKSPERAFNAPAGLLLQPVLPTKVADFEKFLGYVRDALARTTDATLQQQAKSWKFFKMAEPGPNSDVLFVFMFDPTVPCADYALGPILSAAVPDAAKLSEIWNLYKGSVRGGATLMNLVPVTEAADQKAK